MRIVKELAIEAEEYAERDCKEGCTPCAMESVRKRMMGKMLQRFLCDQEVASGPSMLLRANGR